MLHRRIITYSMLGRKGCTPLAEHVPPQPEPFPSDDGKEPANL
jgi:hypothetical protein